MFFDNNVCNHYYVTTITNAMEQKSLFGALSESVLNPISTPRVRTDLHFCIYKLDSSS